MAASIGGLISLVVSKIVPRKFDTQDRTDLRDCADVKKRPKFVEAADPE